MKRKYKCCQCGKVNEFETEEVERFEVHLRESYDPELKDSRIAYIVECQFCHAENRIKL